jgi:FAD:protein FMN transferase
MHWSAAWIGLMGWAGAAGVVGAERPLIAWQGRTMGSTYVVKLVDAALSEPQVTSLKDAIERRLQEVNHQMSSFQSDSELSCFNRAAAHAAFPVSPELAFVVREGLELSRRSHGAFDPTLGALINLWGFGEQTNARAVPSENQLRAALAQTGGGHLTVTAQDALVKDIPGLALNLSSPAKGFGVDAMARVLQGHGLTNYYTAIGGDVSTSGHNPQGQKWQVGVAAPLPDWRPGDPMVTVLALSGQAVSTSGDYEKYFVDAQGRRLGHIFDPKTGFPVQHALASVTVVADRCMRSSSLATTLFVMGPVAGPAWIETWTNAAALFVVREADGRPRIITSHRFVELTGYRP